MQVSGEMLLAMLLPLQVTAWKPALQSTVGVVRPARQPGVRCELDEDWQDWLENGLSCVEYESENGDMRLGVYTAYSVIEDEPHIRPLCASSEDEGVSALLCDEEVPAVPLTAVRRVLDPDYVFVSERQAGGGQGLGNPHGEHGEECYDLSEVEK